MASQKIRMIMVSCYFTDMKRL